MYSSLIIFCCFVGATTVLSLVSATATLDEAIKGLVHQSNSVPSSASVKDKDLTFPFYVSGYDFEDRPVIVMEWGRWDIRTLSEKGGDYVSRFEKGVDEFVKLAKSGFFNKKTKGSEPSNYDDSLVGIIDFDGLSLRQLGTPASVALFVRNLGKLERVYNEFAYGYLVNSNPLVDQVINLAKPYMGKFLDRCEVYGTVSRKWIPKILRKIPRSQLHSAYGGTKDFRPVAVHNIF